MKKNKLALALTATLGLGAFAGTAQAVNVSNEGIGEMFYIPYFSVTRGQEEQIRIVNTSDLTVAAKIYFRRGTDSLEVRDFNIILSPKDVWSGKIESSSNGTNAKISTTDTTCTVPTKTNGWTNEGSGKYSVEFDKSLFGSSVSAISQNVLPGFQGRSIPSIKEGYVTVVVMGVSHISTDTPNTVPFLAKHINQVPRDCGSIDWGFQNAPVSVKSQFSPSEDVLSVTATMVDVNRGSAVNVPVTTLANAFDQNNVQGPGTVRPREVDLTPATSNVFVDSSARLIGGDFSSVTAGLASVRALSSTIISESVFGNYDTTANAQGSWVVTFPTKRDLLSFFAGSRANVAPFDDSVVTIGTSAYDDEETSSSPLSQFSPFTPPASAALPYEVNVLTFSNQNPLSSELTTDLAQPYPKGWLQLGFPQSVDIQGTLTDSTSASIDRNTIKNAVYKGMPVIGFEYNESPAVAASTSLRYKKNITTN